MADPLYGRPFICVGVGVLDRPVGPLPCEFVQGEVRRHLGNACMACCMQCGGFEGGVRGAGVLVL